MLSLRFQSRRAMQMCLWITMLSRFIDTYPIVLNINVDSEHIILGLGKDADRFVYCVCYNYPYPCTIPSDNLDSYSDTQSQALTAENAANYTRDEFRLCQYNQFTNDVSCTQDKTTNCSSNLCTINIIIPCYGKNVILTWDSKQQPSVLGVTGVPVIDCCKTSTTTITKVTTTSTTSPATIFTSSNATTDATTFPDSTIHFGFSQSTTPAPGTITSNITYWETINQQMETTDTQSRTFNQQSGTNNGKFELSSQYIGIIVGTAVAAILVTIAIMCVCWKLKTRRKINRRNDTAEGAISVSVTPEGPKNHVLRHSVNKTVKKAAKTTTLVSPLVQCGARESCLIQPAGDYTYIDINSAASRKSNPALTPSSPSVEENLENSTAAVAVIETHDSEHSQETSNIRQENPHNLYDQQNRPAAISPCIIPATPLDHQQLNHYLQTPNSYLRTTVQHISQPIGANENSSLYSNLGQSKVVRENTYNSLHNLNDDPNTEPCFSQQRNTSNPTAENRPETTVSQNPKLQLSPHKTKDKSMNIDDVLPYTYTEVTPKTTREKLKDSNQVKEANDQTIVTTSKSDHLMPRTIYSCNPTIDSNLRKETVKDIKENNTNVRERQVYTNAVYTMHEIPGEENTCFSLEDNCLR